MWGFLITRITNEYIIKYLLYTVRQKRAHVVHAFLLQKKYIFLRFAVTKIKHLYESKNRFVYQPKVVIIYIILL